MSSVKPNQRLRSLASIRPAALSAATTVHPIRWGCVERPIECDIASKRGRTGGTISGYGSPLLLGNLGAFIGPPGCRPSAVRTVTYGDKSRGIVGIGRECRGIGGTVLAPSGRNGQGT